jgi:hypothetical protein
MKTRLTRGVLLAAVLMACVVYGTVQVHMAHADPVNPPKCERTLDC